MDLNLVDATFSLEYLALNVGGNIIVGGDAITEESVTVTVANQITVKGTPKIWGNMTEILGWYTIAGQADWKKFVFNGKTGSVSNLPVNTQLCVRYNHTDSALRQFVVPSAIIPSECYAILTAPLFQADQKNFTTSSQVGQLVIEIPRFLLSGTQDLSMNMSGASTTNLAGSALASFVGNESCNQGGYYAKIKEIIFGKAWYEDLVAMGVENADMSVSISETENLRVVGIYSGGATGMISNANLTFTSSSPSVATVSNLGVVTGVSTGTTTIKIVATDKTDIEAYAQVTVS